MRDILTILAVVVIAVLAAALAVPPFVDWTAHRALVERGIARALGQEVRTEGNLDLRLLPSPRIRVQRLRVGGPETASLDAMYVRAEIALTPLLSGEVRLLDARIGRAEIRLPAAAGDEPQVPAGLLGDAARLKGWALEDLRIEQFLLTLADPATGRTDQLVAEAVRIQAGSPLGPWRLDGRSRGVPIEIALGELAADRTASLKLGAGDASRGRLDLDGQLALVPAPGDMLRARVAGTARASAGPPEAPVLAQASVTTVGRAAELTGLTVEGGEKGAVRLSGDGALRLDPPSLELRLAGRRVDLAALRPALDRPGWRAGTPLPLRLSLKLDSVAVGADEDLSGLSLSLRVEGERGDVAAFEVAGPGRAVLRANGSFRLGAVPGAAGHLSLEAADGQRAARTLESLGIPGLSGFFAPQPIEASTDISFVDPVVSLRALRVSQGETRLSGALRHTAAEGGARPRLDAQLAVEGLDVSSLPQGAPVFALARGRDLGLTIDARNVAHGGRRGGRITGRIVTEGSSVVVDALEVRDLAGATADLSGRIAPDGSGRIEGRLKAPQAAPLLDLFGQAWIGGLARLVPAVVRDAPIDLRVEVERTGPGAASAIRTMLQGQAGTAPFEASSRTGDAGLAAITLRTDAAPLLGLPPSSGGARIAISGERGPDGRLAATLTGEMAGLAIRTATPIRLGEGDDRFDSGDVALESADASPILSRFGLRGGGPIPLSLTLKLARAPSAALAITGHAAGTRVAAELTGASLQEIRGSARLEALSLPWLASALLLGPVEPPSRGSPWSAARFQAQPAIPLAGSLDVRTSRLDLGLGLQGRDAAFTLVAAPTGLRLARADLALGEARLRGEIGLDRQGGLVALTGDAAIEGLAVRSLLAAPFAEGRATARLRFGSSGESVAGILAALGGAGDVTVEGLRIDGADPAAPGRLASRVLRTDDPLASQRWQPLLAEELGRGPLVATRQASASGALVGGALRLSPLRLEAAAGIWQGAATLDLRTLSLDMRGALQGGEPPHGWSGAPPVLGLGWTGPFGRIARVTDPSLLVNGLATNVLARELDRVETFELDASERRRRNSREEMDRQRRADEARRAEEARRQREREAAPAPAPLPPEAPPSPPGPGG